MFIDGYGLAGDATPPRATCDVGAYQVYRNGLGVSGGTVVKAY